MLCAGRRCITRGGLGCGRRCPADDSCSPKIHSWRMIWGRLTRRECEVERGSPAVDERDEAMNRRWLARSAFALMAAAVAVLIGFAGLQSLAMVGVGVVAACLILAGAYWFLAHRGVLRWLAFGLVVLTPVAVLVVFTLNNLVWVALASVALMLLAGGAARRSVPPAPHATG